MNEKEDFIKSQWNNSLETHPEKTTFREEDPIFEVSLRPQSLLEFTGQDEVKDRLEIFIGAAKKRQEVLGHLLLSGPPGLGKTTLANIIAKSMESSIIITSGAVLERPADLAGILTNLQKGDILFIDEIHRLHRSLEEYLYPAMEDFILDLVIDSGPSARTVRVKLNPFTLVGATTRMGLLSSPLRSRFALNCRLDYYTPETLQKILKRSTHILKFPLCDEATLEIALRSRGTPRTANHLLRWVRDWAETRKVVHPIDEAEVQKAIGLLRIDHRGLDEMDKRILTVMIDHYGGGPVGINTLAVAVGEEPHTLEEVYEPFLILQGFLKRTPRGREATPLAYKHLGKLSNNKANTDYPNNLF